MKTNKLFGIVVVLVVFYVFYSVFASNKLNKEQFGHHGDSSYLQPACSNDTLGLRQKWWWDPKYMSQRIRDLHPTFSVPNPFNPISPSEEVQGDLRLTNLYRRLHNVEGVSRYELWGNHAWKLPGGGAGQNSRQFWLGENVDRQRMLLQKLTRDDIAANRRPWSDAYANAVPTTPLLGNFDDCHYGDCQWRYDTEGKILGIPSVPGIRHEYY